jgi:SAM-dependent methyltransferase
MTWNDQYERYSKIWGDRPSELAVVVVSYLRNKAIKTESLTILDVACGYGRDTFYLHQKLVSCQA